MRIPYYIVFSGYTDELQVFGLVTNRYQPLALEEGRFWLEEIQLGIGLWFDNYQGIERHWLRWYDAQGNWILTHEEQEFQRAEQERQQVQEISLELEQERQRTAKMAEYLRSLGIDPNNLPQ